MGGVRAIRSRATAAIAFLAAAAGHCLIFEAPPTAPVGGVEQLHRAGIALGALMPALAVERGSGDAKARLAGSGIAAIYLASVAIISGFQPAAGDQSELVLDLSVRQQGQVLLSALWGIVGLAGLIAALRQNVVAPRTSALVLLLAAVAKVFLYDLSILTSIYRVISFLVLGGLLLAGAFAYQRLRPPPQPDLRSVHRSLR
ncbi:MAG TPA: DUF2339 domain-containing protein [Solirubrobacteraceae bacterium]